MDKPKRNEPHFITNIKESQAIGDCSVCGPEQSVRLVTAHNSSGKRWSCKYVLIRTELRIMFNITPEQYQALVDLQEGKCAICKTFEIKYYKKTEKITRLCVDHDHSCCPGKKSCGKCIRGLLCWHCNSSIGKMKDDSALLRKAADYLESPKLVFTEGGVQCVQPYHQLPLF